jgi:hypothetical protein
MFRIFSKDRWLPAIDFIMQQLLLIRSQQAEQVDDRLLRDKLARQGDKIVARWNAQMFSQNFEDSIIAEIVARIGDGPRTFVEIGTETGEESNTRLLLALGWKGLWVEGSPDHVARAQSVFAEEIAEGRLQVVQAFVTRDNVQGIIDAADLGELDFLSVDIDMMTSHIWRAISTKPRFACIEYNGNLPPNLEFELPYDPAAVWKGDAWYGAALKTLETIGRAQSMSLVGCDLFGINAFFVRDDLTGDKFLAPFTAETHWEPIRLGQVKRRGHKRP